MKKLLLILLIISGIIPSLGIIKSLSVFDFYFIGYLIYLLIKNKINKFKFIFLITFFIILILISNLSLIFNSTHAIDIENFFQSLVYIFRLFEMFLFIYILIYITGHKLEILQQSVYFSIIVTFLMSVIYTILVILNILTDIDAISGTGRFSSFFGNANGYGYFLLYVLITNIYYTNNSTIKNILSLLIFLNILLTASFSAILLLLIILLLQIRVENIFKYSFLLFIVICTLYVTFELYSIYLPNRIHEIILLGNIHSVGTYSIRSEHIKMALELIGNNTEYFSLLGLGLGNSNIFVDNDALVGPHNSFVNLVLMLGIIPTILIVVWFFLILISLYKKSSSKRIFFTYLIPFLGYFIFAPIAYLPQVYIPLVMVLTNKFKKVRYKND